MVTISDDAWLEAFFGEGNAWNLEKIRNAGYKGVLQSHLETMLQPCLQNRLPFVLPRIDSDKRLWFYVIGEDRRQLAELQRIVTAYLGNVLTSLDPHIFVSSDDPIENSLLNQFSHGFSRICIPQELNADKPAVYSVFNTLNSAIERYSQRPPGFSLTQRPTGRILSDFFIACGRHDGIATLDYFEELKSSGKLSSRNLVSLELQALAAGKDWRAVIDHPRLSDILGARIPGAIADVVLNAVKHLSIGSEVPGDNDIEKLQVELQGLSTLFLRSPDIDAERRIDLWKVWAIGAAALGYSRVLDAIPVTSLGQEWVDRLAEWAGLKTEKVRTVDLLKAAVRAEPSVESANALLQQCIGASERIGLEIYQRLLIYPSEIMEQVRDHYQSRALLESLESDYSESIVVDSWSSWLSTLIDDSEHAIPFQVVMEDCRHWKRDQWDEDQVTKQLYNLADTENASIVRDVIPLLRSWLLENNLSISAVFIEQLVVMLAVDDIYSVQDLTLYADLIDDLADVPHTKEQYQELVGATAGCWTRVKSVNSLEQGLEAMDVLLDSVCADTQVRLNFWNSLQEFCIASWDRLANSQKLVVVRTAEEAIGSSDQFPPLQGASEDALAQQPDLSNKRLAIYTLTEGAARRAKAVLGEFFPTLEIKLNHDKSATSAIMNLAKTADYFIFASRSAAHQAFYPVTKERDDILYPAGKGSSSIVRCFLEAIQGE